MGLQTITIIGRVGKDPIVNEKDGKYAANFSVAVTEKFNGKEHTEWFKVVAFGGLAEKVIKPYVQKGMQVAVSGKLRTEKYEHEGENRSVTKLIVDQFEMLSGEKAE